MDGNVVDSVLHRLRGNTKNRQGPSSVRRDITAGSNHLHNGGVGEGIQVDENNSRNDRHQYASTSKGLARSLAVLHPEEAPVTRGTNTVVRFVVTKLSWRGLYRRIMVISRSTDSIQEEQKQQLWLETYHPDTGHRTNAWSIGGDSSNDVVGVAVGGDHPHEGGMFVVTLRSGSGTKEAKFACHERAGLLDALYTAMHGAESHHAIPSDTGMVFSAVKFSRSRREYCSKHVLLHIRDTGVYQLDEKNNTVSSWRWRFVRAGRPGVRLLGRGGGVSNTTNDSAQQVCPPGYHALALCSHEGQSHMRVFAVKRRDVFCQTLCDVAKGRVGVVVEVDGSTASVAPEDIIAGLAAAEKETIDGLLSGISVSEWNVLKIKMNVDDSTVKKTTGRRCMVTKTHVVERRVDHYDVGSYRSLSSIACLIRYSHDAQLLGIEWGDGSPRDVYISSERDAFLTCLLYAGQLAAQRPLEVLSQPLASGDPLVRIHFHPVGSPALFYDAITESISMRHVLDASMAFIQASCHSLSMNALAVAVWSDVDGDVNVDAVRKLYRRLIEFNASVPYTGIEKDVVVDHHIVDALFAFLPRAGGGGALTMQEERVVITALHALQRICCSHSAKAYILGLGGSFRRIFQCLECDNDHVSMEAARWLLRLFMGTSNPHVLCQPAWSKNVNDSVSPMERHEIMLASRMAKSVAFLSDARCSTIVGVLKGRKIVSELLGGLIVELIVSVACFPGAETTDMATRETMIQEVSSLGRILFRVCRDTRLQVYDGLGLVMRTLAEGGSKAAEPMRYAALHEGAILTHLRESLMVINAEVEDKALSSRELVSLWCDGFGPAMDLIRRIFPPGLTMYLDRGAVRKKRPSQEQILNDPPSNSMADVYVAGRGHQSAYSFLQGDWSSFWEHVDLDCHHAGLIWNETCRSELRQSLKTEENLLHVGRQKLMESLEQNPSWNYGDFRVHYKSLMHQMQVGGIYVKLLVESKGDATVLEHIRNPKEFVSSAYMYFLTAKEEYSGLQDGSMAVEMQYICIEAISMIYKRYCGLIGPFVESQIRHVLQLCDASSDRKLRFLCLKLLHAIVNPDHVLEDDTIRKIAKENAIQTAHHGGISLFCDAVATIHQVSSSYASSTKDTKLIAAGSFNVQQPKLWYYADSMESVAGCDRDEVFAQFEKVKKGPVTKKEIRMHYTTGLINNATYMHRIGMKYAMPLSSIRELRWWCDHGSSPYPERDFSLKALESLICIFELCPARDANSGIQLLPLPICHRNFSPKSSISRVVQAMLTNDPEFVNKACKLLRLFVEQNAEEMKTIYQTGVFYYILSYSGSDLLEPAKFLKCTHLQQKFIPSDGGFGDALSKRSILGDFLPESLLFVLESYGPEAFSTAITGDSETPEIIWTHVMRGQNLIPHLWNHIGDFASLLKESWAVTYDYYPCPPVIYDEIDGEIWCHRYYLRHLCNTLAYPDWKIVDHIEFLQSVLSAWKTEISKVGVKSMSTEEAALLLELEPGSNISESDMKKAYRRLAKKYHPDRNPAGRDQFEAIHEAYMRLHSAKEEVSGPRDWCILLYIQAQCLLYKSHSESLKDYKYAGYPYLIASLSLSNNSDHEDFGLILSESFLPLLSATFELCWLTCESSELNAEELMRSGGTDILEKIFSRCVSIVPSDMPSTSPLAVVMTNILKTLATMASFESAQSELQDKEQLLKDAIKCIDLERAYNVISASLKFLTAISGSQTARADLIMYKTPITLVPRLFGYDRTLVETSVETKNEFEFLGSGKNGSTRAQQDLHDIAILSCALLDKLLGTQIVTDSIPISSGQFALQAMFTPAVSRYIHDHTTFLEAINCIRDDHLVIWNETMKKHLLETMQNIKTFDPTKYLQSMTEIRYESLIGETFISGVYLNNFCKVPSKDGVDDVEFCKSLVKALHSLQQMDESSYGDATNLLKDEECRLESPGNTIEHKKDESYKEMLGRTLILCLEALQKVLGLSPKLLGLLSTVGSIEPISSLLMWNVQYDGCLTGCPLEVPDMLMATNLAISVLKTLCSNAKCLAAICAPNTPLLLSLLMDSPPSDSILAGACECLIHVAEQAEFAKFCSDAGGIFYLLNFVIQDTPNLDEKDSKILQTLRLKCLQAIVKASSNPVHGMKCVIILERLLPEGIVSRLLNDNTESCYEILHTTSKNPEIIWNKETMSQLGAELSIICDAARREQVAKIDGLNRHQKIEWYIRQDFKIKYKCLDIHTEIGGVYIDLLLENPGYPVRNPQSLLDRTVKAFLHASSAYEDSEMLVSVVTMLVSGHPTLADHGVSAGYLTSLVQVLADMLKDGIPIQKSPRAMSCMKLIHALSTSTLSSESLVRVEPPVLHVLMETLQGEPQMKLMALEIIKRALGVHQSGRDIIIRSALDFNLLPRLFELLNWRPVEGDSEKSVNAMIQFLCIEIVRSMEQDGPYKASIKTILDNSDVWSAYKSQKHDLFLPSGAQQASSLLSLAQGSHQSYLLTGGEQQAEDEHAIGDDLIEKAMAQDDR